MAVMHPAVRTMPRPAWPVVGQLYVPPRDWEGQAAFLIGGGSSLVGFDFNCLRGRNVIGINDAYRLGEEIVKVVLFGDSSFFYRNIGNLSTFKGDVVSCSSNLLNARWSWLKRMKRIKEGFYHGDTLGWNHNTGAAAINLAASKGATQIYLLGYDGGRIKGRTHWHTESHEHVPDSSYARFNAGFQVLAKAIQEHNERLAAAAQAALAIRNSDNEPLLEPTTQPRASQAQARTIQVVNVTDGSSLLPVFPRISFATFKEVLAS